MHITLDARLFKETGVGRYIRSLIEYLPKIDRKNEYSLIVLEKDKADIKKIAPAFKIFTTTARWHGFGEQITLPALLHKIKPDLVHFPYFNVPLLYRDPFVVTIHDLTILKLATGRATTHSKLYYNFKKWAFEKSLSHAVYQSKKIITVSETVKKELIDHFKIDSQKICVTYEAGDLEKNKENNKLINPELFVNGVLSKYLLYVGNAHPHKNLEKLITAFQSVRSKYPDLKLVLIGNDDFFYQRLQNETPKELKENILFLGPVGNSDLINYYQNAYAFIFPSLSEGFGIPGLEAMKLGCPLLCSNIPVFQEIYSSACLMFNPEDPEDIASKISQLVSDPDLRLELIEKGYQRASNFTWSKMAKETLNIYVNP